MRDRPTKTYNTHTLIRQRREEKKMAEEIFRCYERTLLVCTDDRNRSHNGRAHAYAVLPAGDRSAMETHLLVSQQAHEQATVSMPPSRGQSMPLPSSKPPPRQTRQHCIVCVASASSGVDPGGEGGDCPSPNKNIPGREYLFAPSKF